MNQTQNGSFPPHVIHDRIARKTLSAIRTCIHIVRFRRIFAVNVAAAFFGLADLVWSTCEENAAYAEIVNPHAYRGSR